MYDESQVLTMQLLPRLFSCCLCSSLQEFRSSSPLPDGKVNQLQEALAAYPDVRPRSMEWCLKLIDALFKSKRVKVHCIIIYC